jgi:hypothetical protein
MPSTDLVAVRQWLGALERKTTRWGGVGVTECAAAADEQPHPERHVGRFLVAVDQIEDRGPGRGWPVVTSGVGDGDEGFPGVGGTVLDRQGRIGLA